MLFCNRFYSLKFKENDKTFEIIRHVSTETSVIFYWLIYKALSWIYKYGKSANYARNNGMYIKRDNVRIKRIVLDLRDAVVD